MKTVVGQVSVSESRDAICEVLSLQTTHYLVFGRLLSSSWPLNTSSHVRAAERQWETLLTESEPQELSSLFIHCRCSGKLPEVRSVFIIHFFWLQQYFPEVITANKKDSYSVSDKCKNCEIVTIDLLMFSFLSAWCFSLSLSRRVLQI